MDNYTFNLKILSPKQIIFEGEVLSVSSANSMGKFDILAEHGNFITLVEDKPITIVTDKKDKKEFQFALAIIYTASNQVKIYTEIQSQLQNN